MLLVVLERVRETKKDLQDQWSTKAKLIAEMNRLDPRTYTGVTAFEGDELFIRKALSIYNSMESEPQIARGQDEVANPVGWNRMLGTLWGNVAPEFIRPEIPERPNLFMRPGGVDGSTRLYSKMGDMFGLFGSAASDVGFLLEMELKAIINLDKEIGLQSERAPQHRQEEENEFTDIIT